MPKPRAESVRPPGGPPPPAAADDGGTAAWWPRPVRPRAADNGPARQPAARRPRQPTRRCAPAWCHPASRWSGGDVAAHSRCRCQHSGERVPGNRLGLVLRPGASAQPLRDADTRLHRCRRGAGAALRERSPNCATASRREQNSPRGHAELGMPGDRPPQTSCARCSTLRHAPHHPNCTTPTAGMRGARLRSRARCDGVREGQRVIAGTPDEPVDVRCRFASHGRARHGTSAPLSLSGRRPDCRVRVRRRRQRQRMGCVPPRDSPPAATN